MNTGVYANPQELEEVKSLAAKAALSGMTSSRFGFVKSDEGMRQVQVRVHELALAHGLPEIEGFYGMNSDGEFTTT